MGADKDPPRNVDAIRMRRTSSLLLVNSGPESFETDPESSKEFSYKSEGKKNWLRLLLLNTGGEHDDGAHKVSGCFASISVITLLAVGFLTVKYLDTKLPKALHVKDIPEHPHCFIEERARSDLHHLTSVGVRVSGDPVTDNVTVSNILNILKDIRAWDLSLENSLEFEVQRPTGAFFRDSDEGQTTCYSKIANVIAKLEPSNPMYLTNHTILVNCHFDTKPGSPGATDDMISCAVMLEIIRVLGAETPSRLRNPIIFLFNGAEELGLKGAHGFIKGYDGVLGNPNKAEKGHRWARNLKTFINLEGAGGGGREILFQTGPGNSWTLNAYAKSAPHPYGVAIAEDAFQFGLIPSDTDFRIFRDFGNLSGLDMAFIKNGWVYHTKWDKLNEIQPGSIQHMGANTLATLRHFTKLDFDNIDTDSSGKMVFFDVLGLFMIYYPQWAGILINCLVALGTIAAIIMNSWSKASSKKNLVVSLIWLPASAILSWAIGIGVAALVAIFLNGCGYYKPFYSYPAISIVIFGLPSVIAQVIVHSYMQNRSPMQTWLANKLALALVLLVMTFVTRSVFILALNLLFSVISWNLAKYLCRGWPRAITLSYLIVGEFIPSIMSLYLLITLSDVFVPILGRSGSETNANLFFGIITSGVVILLIWNGFCFVFVQFHKATLWACLLIVFFVGNGLIVFGLVGKVPYQDKTPMRLNIVNLDRTWHAADGKTVEKTEAGFWFWPYDSNTKDFFETFEKFVPELSAIENVKIEYNDCESLYCAQPFMWPMANSIKTTHWLAHNHSLPNPITVPVTMTYNVSGSHTDNVRKVEFAFHGPTQISVVLSPGPKYKLINWTLTETIPKSGKPWKGRNTYFIYHGRGMEQQEIKFSCDFELVEKDSRDRKVDADNIPLVTVQYTAFYLYGNELMDNEFRDFVERLPAWTYTMPWTAVLKMYEILA